MDHRTIDVYERRASLWRRRRPVRDLDGPRAFAAGVPEGGVRADLGCGPGRLTPGLGRPVVALDASLAMVELCRERAPHSLPVVADLEALPLRRGALSGAWAKACYEHLPHERLPLALADLHRSVGADGPVELTMPHGDGTSRTSRNDDFPGRLFAGWREQPLRDVLAGAGFAEVAVDEVNGWLRARARRARTLADTVGPGMRLLFVGLNPSLYAADAGVGFARPGNRFWPALEAAGMSCGVRDGRHLLLAHGLGMTDLVKRATVGAAELDADEYREGLSRVERLVAWLKPAAVCFVGLSGWRAAVEPRAVAGRQQQRLGGVPVHLVPSTSGRNAHVRTDGLVRDLLAAAEPLTRVPAHGA